MTSEDDDKRDANDVLREDGPDELRRRSDRATRVVVKKQEKKEILYRLADLAATPLATVVYVPIAASAAGGRRAVEALRGWGLAATAVTARRWREEANQYFQSRDMVLLPAAGTFERSHAGAVARSLSPLARRVRVVQLPDLPDRGGAAEWRAGGGTVERLEELVLLSPSWEPPADEARDGEEGAPVHPEFSEGAIALKMVARHAGDLRYVSKLDRWYLWTGTYWRHDEKRKAFAMSHRVCTEVAATVIEPASLPRTINNAKTMESVLKLVGVNDKIAAEVDQWDADPWLLCTPDGVVDLRTGEIREARPEDYATKITAVGPAGEELEEAAPPDETSEPGEEPGVASSCPMWLEFLGRVTGGDAALQAYLQRAAGYMLTGVTVEHAMFFLYGLGSNGKSTFIKTIAGIMGTYHRTSEIETFTVSQTDRHPTELAVLYGARLVTVVETEEGRRWAESRVKALTGGDRITARFLFKDSFEFDPAFKLVIYGNHKPGIRSVDEAMRRRMNLIPFLITIDKVERDEYFGEKLRAEWPGILAWMIEGCLAWQREKLSAPEAVLSATGKYLDEEDTFGVWLDDRCARDAQVFTPTSWLFYSWKKWAEQAGEYVGSQKRFSQKLEASGFTPVVSRVDGKQNRGYRGVRLLQNSGESGETRSGDESPF